jgi:predicted aconitase with swiveling domain
MPIVLRCHPGIGPAVHGVALVARDNFSARYDLDRKSGVFSRPTHKLAGQSYVGKILVLNEAKGGVATAWMLRDMMERGLAPLALIFNRVNPILARRRLCRGRAGRPLRRRCHRSHPHRRRAARRPCGGVRRNPQPLIGAPLPEGIVRHPHARLTPF